VSRQAVLRLAGAALILAAILSAALVGGEEKVAFNVQTRKYHCLTCRWAIRCTRNCVEIELAEARRRGGIPCKVCGGRCKPKPG